MRRRHGPALVAWLLVMLAPALSLAHSLAFGELRVVESERGEVSATLHLRGASDPRALAIDLGSQCEATEAPRWEREGSGTVLRQAFGCGGLGLSEAEVGLAGPARGEAQLVVRLESADGRRLQQTIRGDERASLGRPPTTLGVLWHHTVLGVEHIWRGVDHLLFVLGLVLLSWHGTAEGRGRVAWRRLLLTLTAFTLGHSLTLALTVLDLLRLRPAAVEAVIALSIVLLAVELVRPGADHGLTRRYPWVVAVGFGLLHGCGFAGALREVGLPEDALGPALVGFNLGVEAGQLAFVAVLGIGAAVVTRLAPSLRSPRGRWSMAYAMGGLASAWLLERLTVLG